MIVAELVTMHKIVCPSTPFFATNCDHLDSPSVIIQPLYRHYAVM